MFEGTMQRQDSEGTAHEVLYLVQRFEVIGWVVYEQGKAMPVIPGLPEKDRAKLMAAIEESGLGCTGEKQLGCLPVMAPRWLYVAVFVCGTKRVTNIPLCFAPDDQGKAVMEAMDSRIKEIFGLKLIKPDYPEEHFE